MSTYHFKKCIILSSRITNNVSSNITNAVATSCHGYHYMGTKERKKERKKKIFLVLSICGLRNIIIY
jgi:hypothetical protein